MGSIYPQFTQSIRKYLSQFGTKTLSQSETELEFRFGYFTDKVFVAQQSLLQFKKVLEYVQSLKPMVIKGGQISLDIGLSGSRRMSLVGREHVMRYCQTGRLPTNITYMTKSKSQESTHEIKEYDLRVQLAGEKPMTDASEIALFNSELAKGVKNYRYKQRYSFLLTPDIQLDLTIVKDKKNENKDFKESGVLQQKEHYEIELEWIGKDKTQALTDDQLITWLYRILCQTKNTFAVVSNQEINQILEEYGHMCYKQIEDRQSYQRILHSASRKRKIFIGLDVMPLTIDNFASITSNYSVTEKADGERCLLLISAHPETQGMLYLINNRMEVTHTGLQSSDKTLFGSLYDGELVETTSKTHIYLIFDCFCFQSNDIRTLPLWDGSEAPDVNQLMMDTPKSSRYHALVYSAGHLETHFLSVSSGNDLRIGYKRYLFATTDDTEEIFRLNQEVYQPGSYNYKLDGLILTPYKAPYPQLTLQRDMSTAWTKMLKWKPITQLSIDFLVEITSKYPINEGNRNYIIARLQVFDPASGKSGEKVDFIPPKQSHDFNMVKLVVETDGLPYSTVDHSVIYNHSVVEFVYDKDREVGFQWVPLRFRPDKTQYQTPNNITTATSNWETIEHPITVDMITTGEIPQNLKQYFGQKGKVLKQYSTKMREYHNRIKEFLLNKLTNAVRQQDPKKPISLLDPACGQGGDLDKWWYNKINYVLALDQDKPALDEANERHTKPSSKNKSLNVNFVWANTKLPIYTGDAGLDQDHRRILTSIMTRRGLESFDLVSCQFAFHYYLESLETLEGILSNVSQNLQIGGYFCFTTLNGSRVFQSLEKQSEINGKTDDGKHDIWRIKKAYDPSVVSLGNFGQKISVYNISIGESPEYLVNIDYVKAVAHQYGLVPLPEGELPQLKFTQGFEELLPIIDPVVDGKQKINMSQSEQTYSFMYSYYVFKKIKVTTHIKEPVPITVKAPAPAPVEPKVSAPVPAPAEQKTQVPVNTTVNESKRELTKNIIAQIKKQQASVPSVPSVPAPIKIKMKAPAPVEPNLVIIPAVPVESAPVKKPKFHPKLSLSDQKPPQQTGGEQEYKVILLP